GGIALSRPSPNEPAGVDCGAVGCLGEPSPGSLLLAYCRGPDAASGADLQLDAVLRRGGQGAACGGRIMKWLPDRYQALRDLLRRGDVEPDVTVELEHHLTLRVEENLAAGMSREEAEREARHRFGDWER